MIVIKDFVYPSLRGGGKTRWLLSQINGRLSTEDRRSRFAVVVPFEVIAARLRSQHIPVDIYTETTFPRAMGRIYDHIFIDDADLFQDPPIELCHKIAPGVPVTLTYTSTTESSIPR